MKKLLLAIILILFIPGTNIYSQEAPKKTNTIILTTSYTSAEEAITDVAHILMDNNIAPSNLNKELTYLITSPHQYKNINNKLTFRAIKRNGKVIVVCTGDYSDGAYYRDALFDQNTIWQTIAKTKFKIGNAYQAWLGFIELATKVPHSYIEFEIR